MRPIIAALLASTAFVPVANAASVDLIGTFNIAGFTLSPEETPEQAQEWTGGNSNPFDNDFSGGFMSPNDSFRYADEAAEQELCETILGYTMLLCDSPTLGLTEEQLEELETEFEEDAEKLRESFEVENLEFEELAVKTRKSDIEIVSTSLVWLPWAVDENGNGKPLFEDDEFVTVEL